MPNTAPAKELLKYFLIYLLLSCLYFNRIFVDGIVILTSDALLQNYPLREFYAGAIKSFTLPLWNPYEFAGLPFLGQMQTGALYPINLLLYLLLPTPYAFNASFLLHYALAGFFTFLYLRAIGLRALPAFAGGAVFALSGFLVNHKPHTAIVNSSVWLPLILFSFEKLRQTLERRYAALAALAVGVQILAGNFQMCVYTYIVVFLFFAYYAFTMEQGKRARFLGYGAAAMALGFMVASPQIFAVMELAEVSYRSAFRRIIGYEYFALYHVYISTLPSLFFPYLYGGGDYGLAEKVAQSDAMVPFVGTGATAVALSCLLLDRRNPHIRFWGVVASVGLLLSLGSSTPLFKLVYHVPVLKEMRAHGRNLLEFSLAVSVLMAVGLERIFYEAEKTRRYLKSVSVILGAVLAASLGAMAFIAFADTEGLAAGMRSAGYMNPAEFLESIGFGNPAVLIPIAFVAAYIAWSLIFIKKHTVSMRYLVIALMVLEGFSFGAFHEMQGPPIKDIARSYGMDEAYAYAGADGPNRVFKVSSSAAGASLYNVAARVGSVNSYDQLSIESYVRLLELNSEGLMPRDMEQLELLLRNNIILSALNTRYIVLSRDIWFAGMDAVAGGAKPGAQEIETRWYPGGGVHSAEGTYEFSPGSGQESPEVHSKVSLKQGAHYMSFVARKAGPKRSALVLRVYFPPDYKQSHRMEVFLDSIFHSEKTVFEAPEDGDYVITFTADSPGPIELREPKLLRVDPYVPPLMKDTLQNTRIPLYPPVYDAGDVIIYSNVNALPRAYMVEEAVPAEDFPEINEKLYSLRVNPGRQALIYERDADTLGGGSFRQGKASVKKYGLNSVEVEAEVEGRGFLVLSDQYYPGWKAYVDGRETRIYETNGIMRGVEVPAGRHAVSFKYRPLKLFLLLGLGFVVAVKLLYLSFFRSG